MRITAERVSWGAIIREVDVAIEPGETVGLIGPNGSGKSSFLRCLAGLRAPTSGVISYDGENIAGWDVRRIARRLAFMEQESAGDSDLRVAEVVALGRIPFRDRWRGLDRADKEIIDAALARLGLTELRRREWRTLSGGERPRCLLLDEPTNHLDVRHQFELMRLLAGTDQTVAVAMHDLPLAARFCDRLILLRHGHLAAAGSPGEVLTAPRLREVYEIDAEIGRDSLGNLAITWS